MILIGLLLIAAAAVAGTWLYLASIDSVGTVGDLSAWGMTIGFEPLSLLIAGAGVTLGLLIGLYLIRSGLGRGARKRKERKELERTAEANRVAAEQAASRRLAEERNARIDATSGTHDSYRRPFADPGDGAASSGTSTATGAGSSTPPPPPPRS